MNKYDFVCLYLPMALEAEQLFRISPVVILAQAAPHTSLPTQYSPQIITNVCQHLK